MTTDNQDAAMAIYVSIAFILYTASLEAAVRAPSSYPVGAISINCRQGPFPTDTRQFVRAGLDCKGLILIFLTLDN
jgi:hypothetical protein